MEKVAVVGLGYVGLPLALLASEKGFSVVGIDKNKEKLDAIKAHEDPVGETFIKKRIENTSLQVSDSTSKTLDSDYVIICVPTPVKKGYIPDLGPVKNAVSSVAKHLKKGAVLIIESTVNPGVCDEIVIPLLEEQGHRVNHDVHVAHCPERINPGDKKWNVANIPRVLGSSSKQGLELSAKFYEKLLDAPVKKMASLKEAEACKIVENSFRDVNIAFVNELAKSFASLNINVKNVIDGAATKPFAFMAHYPSIGVGGHCIPVDPYYLIEYARDYGFEHEFLALARSINNSMPEFAVEQLMSALNEKGQSLDGSKVAVLGLSYKPNVADDRESPSYKLIEALKNKKATVVVYDPYFETKSDANSVDNALRDVDAVVLATNHKEFMEYDFKKPNIKVLIDGKNCLNKSSVNATTIYRGIGV